MPTEADTCRKLVVPKLQSAGWEDEPHSIAEQRTITDGRIVPVGKKGFVRKAPKRADYLLRYTRDFPLAVVEAKPAYRSASDGLQQAKQYAEMLSLIFAYSTNGKEVVEFDYSTGVEDVRSDFPTPMELWDRYKTAKEIGDPLVAEHLLSPLNAEVGKGERYYQLAAINRTVEAILKRDRRILLTMATGTGKTAVAFQICWKLWTARWNLTGEHRRPKILYLADRSILVDQPKDGIFASFDDARAKIEAGEVMKSREINLFCDLPGARRGRATVGALPRVCRRLLRSCDRGRVSPRERTGREFVAIDLGVLRAGDTTWADGDTAPRR